MLNGTASLASYAYDAFEQRIEKDDGTDAVHYVYDLAGRLIAEQDGATGAALREYVYLGLMPAAFVDHSGAAPATYYVHTDQVMLWLPKTLSGRIRNDLRLMFAIGYGRCLATFRPSPARLLSFAQGIGS